jgi:hypothetical protein
LFEKEETLSERLCEKSGQMFVRQICLEFLDKNWY